MSFWSLCISKWWHTPKCHPLPRIDRQKHRHRHTGKMERDNRTEKFFVPTYKKYQLTHQKNIHFQIFLYLWCSEEDTKMWVGEPYSLTRINIPDSWRITTGTTPASGGVTTSSRASGTMRVWFQWRNFWANRFLFSFFHLLSIFNGTKSNLLPSLYHFVCLSYWPLYVWMEVGTCNFEIHKLQNDKSILISLPFHLEIC